MTQYLFANNAKSTLAAPIGPTDTTLTLAAGDGSLFPSPGAGQGFTLSMFDQATARTTEIMLCTSRTGDTLTVTRAQEGTPANSWLAGDFANLFVTAAQLASMAQNTGGTTASRPATPKLYQSYFDTTLGLPITCTQVSPPIWVNGAGVAV